MKPLLLLAVAAAAFAQKPEFEVASIKPTEPNFQGIRIIRPMPGNQSYMAKGIPLRTMMTIAYTVTDRQIAGGPEWVGNDLWDLNAKANRACTSDELHDLLGKLLEDRFKLKIRREKRDLPVWELVVDKAHKMPGHDPNDIDRGPIGPGPNGRGMAGKNVPMNYFAFVLSRLLDRNVVDKTGLSGYFDVTLDFVREAPAGARSEGAPAPPPQDGPTIFTALREQLGLRLVAGRGPVEFLVIDHVEKPTEN